VFSIWQESAPGVRLLGRRFPVGESPTRRIRSSREHSSSHVDGPVWVGTSLLQCNMRGSAIWVLILITQEADVQMGESNSRSRPEPGIQTTRFVESMPALCQPQLITILTFGQSTCVTDFPRETSLTLLRVMPSTSLESLQRPGSYWPEPATEAMPE